MKRAFLFIGIFYIFSLSAQIYHNKITFSYGYDVIEVLEYGKHIKYLKMPTVCTFNTGTNKSKVVCTNELFNNSKTFINIDDDLFDNSQKIKFPKYPVKFYDYKIDVTQYNYLASIKYREYFKEINTNISLLIDFFYHFGLLLRNFQKKEICLDYSFEIDKMIAFINSLPINEFYNKELDFMTRKGFLLKITPEIEAGNFDLFWNFFYTFDVYASIAKGIKLNNLVFPEFNSENNFAIEDFYHLDVKNAVKNTIDINNKNVIVFTGANMSGKSTTMKSISIIVLLAHLGIAVPAKGCNIPFYDSVFLFFSVNDNLNVDYFQTHPDYPNLSAIENTLNFFQIENIVLQFENEDFENLPNIFITSLKSSPNDLILINKNANDILISEKNNQNFKLKTESFLKQWSGIVLAIEENEEKTNAESRKLNNSFKLSSEAIFVIINCLILGYSLWKFTFPEILYTVISLIGLYYCFEIFKNQHGKDSIILNKICNDAEKDKSSCQKIMQSDKTNNSI